MVCRPFLLAYYNEPIMRYQLLPFLRVLLSYMSAYREL